jgi:hypothetical protein
VPSPVSFILTLAPVKYAVPVTLILIVDPHMFIVVFVPPIVTVFVPVFPVPILIVPVRLAPVPILSVSADDVLFAILMAEPESLVPVAMFNTDVLLAFPENALIVPPVRSPLAILNDPLDVVAGPRLSMPPLIVVPRLSVPPGVGFIFINEVDDVPRLIV